MRDEREDVLDLLVHFWTEKDEAMRRNAAAGRSGHGAQARDARHMKPLAFFVRQMFIDAGLDESEVFIDRAIPGYYRRSKNWDVVATHKGQLVGLVELKSQVGSEGNNGNNRIEEALGNAFDAVTAQELNQAFGSLSVWTAFCIVFGSDPGSSRTVGMRTPPLFELDPAFDDMTYGSQWELAVERFIQTRAYDAGWMVVSWIEGGQYVRYIEPVPTATIDTLWTQIEARVRYAKQALSRERQRSR